MAAMTRIARAPFSSRAFRLTASSMFLYCAAAALLRVCLYLWTHVSGMAPEVPRASLTFMPIPDLIFGGLFGWLAVEAMRGRFVRRGETVFTICILNIANLVVYAVIFHRWTDGRAFGLSNLSTYIHVALPVAICLIAGALALKAISPHRPAM